MGPVAWIAAVVLPFRLPAAAVLPFRLSAAAVLLFCLPAVVLRGQRRRAEFRSGPAMRAGFGQNRRARARSRAVPARSKIRSAATTTSNGSTESAETKPKPAAPVSESGVPEPQRPYQQNPQYNGGQRPSPAYPAKWRRVWRAASSRPPGNAYPGRGSSGTSRRLAESAPGLPVDQQERLLRNDPSFNRLPPATQQRLVQQLHQLNQMPEQQRDRRLARSEMLERMSPQQQMQVRQAGAA